MLTRGKVLLLTILCLLSLVSIGFASWTITVDNLDEEVLGSIMNENIINTKERFKKPTLEEIKDYCLNVRHNKVDYQYFYDYFTEGNWIDSKGNKVKNWKQKIITWEKHNPTKKEDDYENYWKEKLNEEK